MELSKARYTLVTIQALVKSRHTRLITRQATQGAQALGWTDRDIVSCILALRAADFYKSMTAHHDTHLWQDVYRPTFRGVAVYVKVQVTSDGRAVVISFKEA